MIVSSEESKRAFRNKFCSRVFGVSNAIPYLKFTLTMYVLGTLLLAFSLVSTVVPALASNVLVRIIIDSEVVLTAVPAPLIF